jgi:hypothetical protein
MVFIIETKALSLIEQITTMELSSDTEGASRFRVLAIKDLARLSVLVSRSPTPLRRLLGGVIESVSAGIVVLSSEIEGPESEWMKVDPDLGWDIKCVSDGLEEVELGMLWEGVLAVYGG